MSLFFEYMCMRLPFIPWSIVGVPSSQALLGYLLTAPQFECVPAVLGPLGEWIQNRKKEKIRDASILGRAATQLYFRRKFGWFSLGLGNISCLGFVLLIFFVVYLF